MMTKSSSSNKKAENNGVIQISSIGLLQERFRQLQRMKEMRQNQELLTMFSDNNNNNNTNTNTPTTTTNPNNNNLTPIVSNTTYTTTPITPINMNSDTPMQYNEDDDNNNDNEKDEEVVKIFMPPNYLSINNPKSSCYPSAAAAAATSSSNTTLSSSSSSGNSKTMMTMMKPSDVSLSLWSYNNTATAPKYPFRPAKEEVVVVVSNRASKCISSFYKWEDPNTLHPLHQQSHHHHHHVTDVDTTLHL